MYQVNEIKNNRKSIMSDSDFNGFSTLGKNTVKDIKISEDSISSGSEAETEQKFDRH